MNNEVMMDEKIRRPDLWRKCRKCHEYRSLKHFNDLPIGSRINQFNQGKKYVCRICDDELGDWTLGQ